MRIGGTARDRVVPDAPGRVVEKDPLEAVIEADRPFGPTVGRLRQRATRQVEPAAFERGPAFGLPIPSAVASAGVVRHSP